MIAYIQEAMAARVWVRLGSSVRDLVHLTVLEAAPFLRAPPPQPWPLFFQRNRQWRTLRRSSQRQQPQ